MRVISILIIMVLYQSCMNDNSRDKKNNDLTDADNLKQIQNNTIKDYSDTDLPQDTLNNYIQIEYYEKVDNIGNSTYVKYKEDNLPDSFKVMINIAKEFAVWYGKNHEVLAQHKLFKYSDSLGYHVFDMEHGNYYLETLQETGLVSDSLISYFYNMFSTSQTEYEYKKPGPETDGPIGYVADIIIASQEQPIELTHEDLRVDEIMVFNNIVHVYLNYWSISFIKEKEEWLIVDTN